MIGAWRSATGTPILARMTKAPRGYYRTRRSDGVEDEAWTEDGEGARYVKESVYRAKGYDPAWEDLPWKEDYDLAEATERAEDA